jgi:hypothetical protein
MIAGSGKRFRQPGVRIHLPMDSSLNSLEPAIVIFGQRGLAEVKIKPL